MTTGTILSPDILRQLELFSLRARRSFLGTRQGGHISPKKGHGIEFSDYRTYELGDDPRHIDWGVFARSEKLYVRRFQEEQDMSIGIIVDCSHSMHTPQGGEKWNTARRLAAAIAYVGLMQQDRVAVSVPGLYEPPFSSGGSAFHEIQRQLSVIEQAAPGHFLFHAQKVISRIRFPGIAVFISDFLMPVEDVRVLIQQMQSRNLEVTAIQVLSEDDLAITEKDESIVAVDSETGEEFSFALSPEKRAEYSELLEAHISAVHQFLQERGIPFLRVHSSNDFTDVLVNELSQLGLFQ